MRDHRQLRAFQLADELVLIVYRVTRDFPKEETFGIRSQIRRSAVSVPSNVVEGCAKTSSSDYLRFLEIAFGSLRDISYQLELSHRLGYIGEGDWTELSQKVEETDKVFTALLRSRRRSSVR